MVLKSVGILRLERRREPLFECYAQNGFRETVRGAVTY